MAASEVIPLVLCISGRWPAARRRASVALQHRLRHGLRAARLTPDMHALATHLLREAAVAFWENLTETIAESWIGTGLLVAGGALLVYPLVRPVLREALKAGIKGGMVAYDQASRAGATIRESMSDIVAEVQAEAREGSTGSRTPERQHQPSTGRAAPQTAAD